MTRPAPDPARSLYDPDPEAADDLWFLPPATPLDPDLPPLPRAERGDLTGLAEWEAAQAALAVELAQTAARFGALDERLRHAGEGARQRLALLEVAELSWHAGDRIGPDRLALWVGLRLAGAQDDAQALARAGWAVRRLTGGPGPLDGGAGGLAAFLGRQEAGADLPGRLDDWAAALGAGATLHPIVRAAWAIGLWSLAEVSPAEAGGIEAHVTAARLAAAAGRGGAVFLPVLLAGPQALRRDGPVARRLARWLAGAEQSCLAAMLQLDRVDAWAARATAALAHLSGRTPPRLIAALATWPMLSAPLAERLTGASRAAVQRNLDVMAAAGLIREVTGQGRFRLWAARL